jgi:hypothetical protein
MAAQTDPTTIYETLLEIVDIIRWRYPMSRDDIMQRMRPFYLLFSKELRRMSPCYCVLAENKKYCHSCPITFSTKAEAIAYKKKEANFTTGCIYFWGECGLDIKKALVYWRHG